MTVTAMAEEPSGILAAVTAASARPIASISASRVRVSALRVSPLVFQNASSMGLRSGEQGGRYTSSQLLP